MSRTYSDVAYMTQRHIMGGFMDARLSDGKSCRLVRLPNGTWQAYLRGLVVHTPQVDWERAYQALEHQLAGEGILLRLRD